MGGGNLGNAFRMCKGQAGCAVDTHVPVEHRTEILVDFFTGCTGENVSPDVAVADVEDAERVVRIVSQ